MKKTCLDCTWCKFKKGWMNKDGSISDKAKITCDAGNWISTQLRQKEVKYWIKKGSNLIAPYSPSRIGNKVFKPCSLFEDAKL